MFIAALNPAVSAHLSHERSQNTGRQLGPLSSAGDPATRDALDDAHRDRLGLIDPRPECCRDFRSHRLEESRQMEGGVAEADARSLGIPCVEVLLEVIL